MSDRLTRKEIKRDEFREALKSGFEFLTSHTRGLVYAGIAVVAVAALVVGLVFYFHARSERAAAALSQAIEVSAAPLNPDAPQPDDPDNPIFADQEARRSRARELFTAVREDFGGSDSATVAAAYLAGMAAEDGDLDTARKLWEEVAEKSADRLLTAEVRLNLLQLDLSQKDPEAVLEELEAMLAQATQPLPEDLILFKLGEVRERLGRTSEALAAYQRIVDEFPQSPFTADARARSTSLEAEG